jgi:hypothetical protein
MTNHEDHPELDLREQIARIDQMLADRDLKRQQFAFAPLQVLQWLADHDRKRQQIRYQPWLAIISGLTAGAALFAAGGAFVKILGL